MDLREQCVFDLWTAAPETVLTRVEKSDVSGRRFYLFALQGQ
jgi:hypothetical protein